MFQIQQEIQWMRSVYHKATPLTKFLIYTIVLGYVFTLLVMFKWIDQITVLGLPQLVYIDLGAYTPWLPMTQLDHYTHYLLAPFLNYNLLQAGLGILTLHILGKWVEKLLGSKVMCILYMGTICISMIIYGFLAERYMSYWFKKYTKFKTLPIIFQDISELD